MSTDKFEKFRTRAAYWRSLISDRNIPEVNAALKDAADFMYKLIAQKETEQEERRKSDTENLTSAVQGLTEVIVVLTEQVGNAPKTKVPAAKKTENLSADQYQLILNTYNDCCGKLPKATKLTDKRKRAIRICLEQGFTLDDFRDAVKKAALIPFFNGNGDRNWRANFDFIIKPDNLQKIIEDTYGSGQENSHSFDTDKLFEHALNTVPTIK